MKAVNYSPVTPEIGKPNIQLTRQLNPEPLATLSHEIMTRLTVIILGCGILRQVAQSTLSEDYLEQLSKIERSAEELHKTVNQLLQAF